MYLIAYLSTMCVINFIILINNLKAVCGTKYTCLSFLIIYIFTKHLLCTSLIIITSSIHPSYHLLFIASIQPYSSSSDTSLNIRVPASSSISGRLVATCSACLETCSARFTKRSLFRHIHINTGDETLVYGVQL